MMEVRRLAWAGIELSAGGTSAVIDFVADFPSLHGPEPPLHEVPEPPPPQSVDVALLTHFHSDHADPAALARALRPDGVVLAPEPEPGSEQEAALVREPETALAASGLRHRSMRPWEGTEVGSLRIAAIPAADGFGDPQVSWCVEGGGRRVLHAGDTLFHGWWWRAAMRLGPFDAAFLPVGGAVVDLPVRQPPSPLPAGMGPEQAAVAAHLLGARTVVPIHYGPIHEADNYVQAPDPCEALAERAGALGIDARPLRPGEAMTIGPAGT